jgi:hypothetical protein
MVGKRPKARGLACGAILAALWLFPLGPVAQAGMIVAVGSSEWMTDGPYAGWYKYTYEVTWTGGKKEGLNHLDLLLTGCPVEEGLIGFDSGVGGHWNWDGISTDGHGSDFDLPCLAALGLR